MSKEKHKYYVVKDPAILSEETWEIGSFHEISEDEYNQIMKKKKGPVSQEHIEKILAKQTDEVKLVWKQEQARMKRMFPNFVWSTQLFDDYIDSLAVQNAIKQGDGTVQIEHKK